RSLRVSAEKPRCIARRAAASPGPATGRTRTVDPSRRETSTPSLKDRPLPDPDPPDGSDPPEPPTPVPPAVLEASDTGPPRALPPSPPPGLPRLGTVARASREPLDPQQNVASPLRGPGTAGGSRVGRAAHTPRGHPQHNDALRVALPHLVVEDRPELVHDRPR